MANPTYEKPSSGGGSSNKVSSGVSANVQPIFARQRKERFFGYFGALGEKITSRLLPATA
ncbi:MAG: hypothetical protein L6V93_15000 [Clostridiales bacterium]|nr:MAG: hypothetical protein L6V93_15000 [Clostridiales bacterium]